MAVGLGIINLLMVHGSRIVFKKTDWGNSLALLSGMVLMGVVFSLDWSWQYSIAGEKANFFHLRDFSNVILTDHAAKKSGVLPASERNRKLQAATKAEFTELQREVFERVSEIDTSGSSEYYAEEKAQWEKFLALIGVCTSTLDRLTVDATSKIDEEANKNVSLCLAQIGVAYGELLSGLYSQTTVKGLYKVLFDGVFTALGSAMFSLLGFYIASAAYRAFRVQSFESLLMMLAALVVMLGQIPFGLKLQQFLAEANIVHLDLPELRNWLLLVPSAAAFRAIKIGAAVAGLVIAFRMWLSIESESFSDDAVSKGGGL
jgi:hypothetical protein